MVYRMLQHLRGWVRLGRPVRHRCTRARATPAEMLREAKMDENNKNNEGSKNNNEGSKNYRKDKVVSVRFSADELRGLQERAEKAHMSLSDYIRTQMSYNPLMYRTFVPAQSNTFTYGTSITSTFIYQ